MAEFASIAGNRGVEFREIAWTQIGETEMRLIRAKQHGVEVVEVIKIDGMIADLITRLAKDDRHGWVFPNSKGGAYTAQAFKLGFNRLKNAARKAGKLPKNFTMHDLRHYFVTAYKQKNKALPELHADSATTSRIYDDSKEVNRGVCDTQSYSRYGNFWLYRHTVRYTKKSARTKSGVLFTGVADGARTNDNRNHNPDFFIFRSVDSSSTINTNQQLTRYTLDKTTV
jgi:hypothetical protein